MFPSNGNYTLGRGKLFFDRFAPGTMTGTGQLYIGNTPELSLSSDSESLDHYSSDEGIREKDDTALLSLSRLGSFVTDHISPSNLAHFFLGDANLLTVAALTNVAFTLNGIKLGRRYQLGVTNSNPVGVRGLSGITISTPAGLVAGTDYILDLATGGITFLAGGTITDGANVSGTYSAAANSFNRIVSGADAQIDGSLLFIANNPRGKNFDYFWPKVSLRPDGDFAIKGDEWQQLGFSFEALKKDDLTEVVYITGRAGDGV